MKIINIDPTYSKLEKSIQHAINVGIDKLIGRLKTYKQYNQSNDAIMDDKLVHDAYVVDGKRFFLYKCRVKTLSLRLLYTFEGEDVIIITHVCKKNPRYEYFDFFENACSEYMHDRKAMIRR